MTDLPYPSGLKGEIRANIPKMLLSRYKSQSITKNCIKMKTKLFNVLCTGMVIVLISCEEKAIDSPEITVFSPKLHEVIDDNDSIRIEAVIKPAHAKITDYSIIVKDKYEKVLFSTQKKCNEPGDVKIKESFFYDINKITNVFLDIAAWKDNEELVRERVPFVLND